MLTDMRDQIETNTMSGEEKKMKALKKIREEREQNEMPRDGKDPFLYFGFGIMSYRNTLLSLTMLFVVFSLITMPLTLKYRAGGALDESVKSKFGKLSLANLGYASVQCETFPIGYGKV